MKEQEILSAMEENNRALRELLAALRGLGESVRETRDKVNDVVNHSHLRSTLGLLKEDIGVRRLLDVAGTHKPSNQNFHDRI